LGEGELCERCQIVTSVKSWLGDETKHWLAGPRTWTPEQIATEILKTLRQGFEQGQRERLNEAVFSIPVGCSARKRQALRRAANAAGIHIKSFVSEPTAAVLKNFKTVRQWPKIAVFDWGGGTLDVSVVEVQRQHARELGTFGVRLGGDDLDHKLALHVHSEIARRRGLDVPFEALPPVARDILKARVEAAKCQLASEDSVEIRMASYGKLLGVSHTLTSQKLRSLLQPEYEKAWRALEETVLRKAHSSFEEIGCVLMVGGSSKLRGLADNIEERSERPVERPADADWNIAQGAAIVSAMPGGHVIARGLGLSVSDGTYFPLLRAGEQLDQKACEHHFGLVEDAEEARFVFVEPHRQDSGEGDNFCYETLDYMNVPAFGFSDEPITLRTRVTEDLVVEVEGRGWHRENAPTVKREFEKLHLRYRLPNNL
jgi:molecular chaperone DnaK